MAKLLFLDTETTGLDEYKHGLIQLSGIIRIGDERKEEFDLRVRPLETDEINPKALEVNGVEPEEIAAYPPADQVHKEWRALLETYVDPYDKRDKFVMIAYNAMFDYQVMRAWFAKLGDKYFGGLVWFPPICAMVLAMQYFRDMRDKLVDFKLATVAHALGIQVDADRLHDAAYDLDLLIKTYDHLVAGIETGCPLPDAR